MKSVVADPETRISIYALTDPIKKEFFMLVEPLILQTESVHILTTVI
jgi:hypothetical protein